MILVALMTYLTASLFLSLFDKAVMALLVSLCVDLDAHDGIPEYGPKTFHDDYVRKTNQQSEQEATNPME